MLALCCVSAAAAVCSVTLPSDVSTTRRPSDKAAASRTAAAEAPLSENDSASGEP